VRVKSKKKKRKQQINNKHKNYLEFVLNCSKKVILSFEKRKIIKKLVHSNKGDKKKII
jgi:hypothetical protein